MIHSSNPNSSTIKSSSTNVYHIKVHHLHFLSIFYHGNIIPWEFLTLIKKNRKGELKTDFLKFSVLMLSFYVQVHMHMYIHTNTQTHTHTPTHTQSMYDKYMYNIWRVDTEVHNYSKLWSFRLILGEPPRKYRITNN